MRHSTLFFLLLLFTPVLAISTQDVVVRSPYDVNVSVNNGLIVLKIDTNYVVPNHKYTATAEIEKNTACSGCYNIYVVLHTPKTPGYAWEPRKLPPIIATIRPEAMEKNITSNVIPVGFAENAETQIDKAARCAKVATSIAEIRAQIAKCEALGCDENEWKRIHAEIEDAKRRNIQYHCNLEIPVAPKHVGTAAIDKIRKELNAMLGKTSVHVDIKTLRVQGSRIIVDGQNTLKIFGIWEINVPVEIYLDENAVHINMPWWASVLQIFSWG
jgi:hypothetical protein